jgi:hypothetical protein
MQIDRARFLLLTASLAGGGCTTNPPPNDPPAPAPTETGQELVVPETPDPATTAIATARPEPTETPSQPGPQPPAGACDNDTGTVAACSINAPPGPHCESFADTKAACKSYKSGLRGGIAAKAVACLNKVSGTPDVCDWEKAQSCALEAVRTACIQPSTFNQCSPLVSQCAANQWGKLSIDDCQRLLSSVKDGKRQAMITCMTEGCSIDSCMWSLR